MLPVQDPHGILRPALRERVDPKRYGSWFGLDGIGRDPAAKRV
jgi:hypothetical protein